jgi:glucose-1-phosphate cytidylyltransferase
MRLRDYSDQIPKPLVPVGARPILWHLMKYYSHFGHTEFILCLGHGAIHIKEFFLQYNEWASNDFVLSDGGRSVEMLGTDIDEWKITFVDTGHDSNIGERLRRAQPYLGDDDVFLANYADGLTDLPLDDYVGAFLSNPHTVASFLTVPVPFSFHFVQTDDVGNVTGLQPASQSDIRINAGYFAFRREIFDYMRPGEELVEEPFERLIDEHRVTAYPYSGFWKNMDTFKEKVVLDQLVATGAPPWMVWDA